LARCNSMSTSAVRAPLIPVSLPTTTPDLRIHGTVARIG
jgi:hypothetical protein